MGEERAQSEFNMAVSYLNRLNALFYTADEAAMGLDTYTWFHSLLALHRELSSEMKEAEFTRCEERIKHINPLISVSISENMKGSGAVNSKLYHELHDFEIDLRRVLKASGLQMKMQDD